MSGWTVGGNGNVGVIDAGATSGSHSAALSAGGDSDNNTLRQRFYTTSGALYVLDFDAGIAGMSDTPMQLRARVFGDGAAQNALDKIVSPPFLNSQPFQHYHFTFTADADATFLEFSDLLLGNLAADILVDSVSVAALPGSFMDWRIAYFSTDQLNDPTISEWNADPDKDGIANGLEYFFHTDPLSGLTIADAGLIPRITLEQIGANRYLTYTFARLLGWTGKPAQVVVSDNLTAWDTSGNQIEPVGNALPSGDGYTEMAKVRLKVPISQGTPSKKFFRLQLSP